MNLPVRIRSSSFTHRSLGFELNTLRGKIFDMSYKEVLTEIPLDDFLVAADRTFEDALELDNISPMESKMSLINLNGLTRLGGYIKRYHLLRLKPQEGQYLRTGVIRQNLALIEWFNQQNEEYQDSDSLNTQLWLRNLETNRLKRIMGSYLQQEGHELKRQDSDEAEMESPEIEAAVEEYPALSAFSDLLYERFLEDSADETAAELISRGAILGTVAVREYIELAQLHHQLSYVQ